MRVVVVNCAAPGDSDIVSDSYRRTADECAGANERMITNSDYAFFGLENKRCVNDAVFTYAKILFAGECVGVVKADIDRFVDNSGRININKTIILIRWNLTFGRSKNP